MKKIVLMYHDVYSSTEKESGFQYPTSYPYKISATKFEEHVRFVYNYCKQNNISQDTFEFTFDDGGESFHRVVTPILEKYGFKGIFFISTLHIESDKFLTIEQIKALQQQGHTVASHSHSHPRNMTELSMNELLMEWQTSVQILEKILENPVRIASIPSGYNSKDVTAAAAQAGIKILYTSKPTTKYTYTSDIILIGRYVIHCNTSIETLNKIISNAYYRRKMLFRWMLINCAKRILGTQYNNIKKYLLR